MRYKKGIIVDNVTLPVGAGTLFLETVEEAENYPVEDIDPSEAYARSFRTILHETDKGAARLISCQVFVDHTKFETDGKQIKIRLVFENDEKETKE